MLSRLRRHLLASKMKRLIKRATRAIYSGCAEPLDVQELAIKIMSSNRSSALLRAFVAIRFAAETGIEAPYNAYMINKILDEVLSGEAELALYDPEPILGLQKARAGVALAERQVHFFLGRIAYEAEAYSYGGLIYKAEKAKRGPLSLKERETFMKLAEEISQAELRLKQHNLQKDRARSKEDEVS